MRALRFALRDARVLNWPVTCLTEFVTSKAGRSSCIEYPIHILSAGMSRFSSSSLMHSRFWKLALAEIRFASDIAAPVELGLAAH